MNDLNGSNENKISTSPSDCEKILYRIHGCATYVTADGFTRIIEDFHTFEKTRWTQVHALVGCEYNILEEINRLVLQNSTVNSDDTDLGMTLFMATEEIAIEILKNTLRLLDYINSYNPQYPASEKSDLLLADFQNKREGLIQEVMQIIYIFGSPGSIFYIPDRCSQQIITSMYEKLRLFENNSITLPSDTPRDLVGIQQKLRSTLIRLGKEKRKISMNHIQSLVTELMISPLRRKFDAMKGELRDTMRTKSKVVYSAIIPEIICKDEPKTSIETATQKARKIQARILSIGVKGVNISEGEKGKILRQISLLEEKYPEINSIISETRHLLFKTLQATDSPRIPEIPRVDEKTRTESFVASIETPVSLEATETSKQLIGQIRALKGEIGNPSSTCTTNKGSYGDGQFWYNYLLPLLNALELILQEDPNFALNFSWKRLAEHEKIHALYNGQKFRHWHAILLGDEKSENVSTEWNKLPSLVSKQIGSGGFNKTNRQPLAILTKSLELYFTKNTEK